MDDTFRRGPLLLLSGRANRPLAEEVGKILARPWNEVTIRDFSDGEIFVRIDRNARGRDVFIIQPTNAPAEYAMELLLLIDAARRASAARVTAVVPYFGYGRQDRKDQPRVAIGAKLMANLMVAAGADRVVSIDFHQHQIQGFFDIPVDHLYAAPVITRYFRSKGLEDLVVVAPDVGSAKMARGFSKRLGATFAIIDKRRPAPNVAEVLTVVGQVEGRNCILTDDMVDTGGTLANAVRGEGCVCFGDPRHPVGIGPAVARGVRPQGVRGDEHDPYSGGASVPTARSIVGRRAPFERDRIHSFKRVREPALRDSRR
jgi:ribose-phosphate pyrophosphokinase